MRKSPAEGQPLGDDPYGDAPYGGDDLSAAEWFVRLRSPSVSAADRAAFRDWIAGDPKHAQAYEHMQRLWQRSEAPAAILGAGGWYRAPRPTRRLRGAGLGIAAVLVLAAGLLWRDPGLPARLAADYATPRGQHAELRLADGSHAFLDRDSAIKVNFAHGRRQVALLRGRIWLEVDETDGQPLELIAEGTTARMTGTRLAVERARDGVSVTVEDGEAAVRPGAGMEALAVSAGERADIGKRTGTTVTSVDSNASLAWRHGFVVFDRTTLAGVAREINRMLPGRVIVTDDSLSALSLSGVFRADAPQSILAALRRGLHVRTTYIPGLATLIHR